VVVACFNSWDQFFLTFGSFHVKWPSKIEIFYLVATCRLALRWMCHSSWMGCVWRTTPIYMLRTSNNKWSWQVISADTNMWTTECNDERTRRVISSGDLYCCLLPQYEALRTCRLGFLIATKWYCDQAVKAMPSETFTKKVRLVQFIVKRMGCCCNLLVGVALNCAIHHEQDLREKQHPYIFGTNKQ